MKSTGIVRRVDDLGRIVIPKETRRLLHITEGDQVEIYTENEAVILKKYSPLRGRESVAGGFVRVLARLTGCGAVIADKDVVIAEAGLKNVSVTGHEVSLPLSAMSEKREVYAYRAGEERICLTKGDSQVYLGVMIPLLSDSDVVGTLSVILPESSAVPDEKTVSAAKTAAALYLNGMD